MALGPEETATPPLIACIQQKLANPLNKAGMACMLLRGGWSWSRVLSLEG